MKTILTLIAAAGLVSCAGTPAGTAGVKPYTKDTCVLSDNKLGSMGPVITKTYDGQQVKFCCQPCVAKFEKNPQRYLAEL
ncbi:MAG: hypothetical protein JWM59_3129 [Verrucomicrobiales bacterium]|nr:hypothetical protein [Verrucomicrobiales bacterium]RYD33814.1 MAG: YHS domain-containing protein [Verrucomicrobiaceae bacterium]